MSSRLALLAAGFCVSAALATPATAQSKLEFSPFVGEMVPVRVLAVDSTGSAALEHSNQTAYGARIAYWVTPRIALEGTLGFSQGDLIIVSTQVLKLRSTAMIADVRARFRLTNPLAKSSVFVTAGAGVVDHRNLLFDAGAEQDLIEIKNPIGAVVGMGATIPVTGDVMLRVDMEDHIHKTEISGTGLGFESDRTQHDLLFSLGAVVPFGF
jgi:outer membrane protein W